MNTDTTVQERQHERGIALVMVLWIIAILVVVVLSFSAMTRTESLATLSFKQISEKKFLAEAGVQRAIVEILYSKTPAALTPLPGADTEDNAWTADGTQYSVDIGGGSCVVSVIDESGKININTLNDVSGIIMKNLLMNTAGVEEETADTIVDSILDWRDADDLVRLHGAESDYYKSLPSPYEAKNANFDTVEELLLVKGMTPEILYGDAEKRGIVDFLTVNSKAIGINITAAPREVLAAIPGISAEVVDDIITARQNKTDTQNVQSLLGTVPAAFRQWVNAGAGGQIFTIDSVAYAGDKAAGYPIRATVSVSSNGDVRYLYYKSPSSVVHGRDSNH